MVVALSDLSVAWTVVEVVHVLSTGENREGDVAAAVVVVVVGDGDSGDEGHQVEEDLVAVVPVVPVAVGRVAYCGAWTVEEYVDHYQCRALAVDSCVEGHHRRYRSHRYCSMMVVEVPGMEHVMMMEEVHRGDAMMAVERCGAVAWETCPGVMMTVVVEVVHVEMTWAVEDHHYCRLDLHQHSHRHSGHRRSWEVVVADSSYPDRVRVHSWTRRMVVEDRLPCCLAVVGL